MKTRTVLLIASIFVLTTSAAGQANGHLQLHFMDVGQGDSAVLVSPRGEIVMFDNGKRGRCELSVNYLQQLGIKHVDYMIASHYHDDHIGCTREVLEKFPLTKVAYDRGHDYNTATYRNYVIAVGDKRATVVEGMAIKLDAASSMPVYVVIVAANGNGIATTNENDLSVVAVVHFGRFDAVFGGDLSGMKSSSYEDIETAVAPKVGEVEVYKVNHHGSRYSSNPTWLQIIKPVIAVISTGDGNRYGHPTAECLDRLHAARIRRVYWTERGAGPDPDPKLDAVANGAIVVDVPSTTASFNVTYAGNTDRYPTWPSKAWQFQSLPQPRKARPRRLASK